MPEPDLTALAAEVAAVLDAHEVTERICEVFPRRAQPPILHIRTNNSWQVSVDEYGIEVRGKVTPVSFDVLSTVWGHVNGQGGKAARDVWPQINPEWVDLGFGAFTCECGETVGGISDAGETCRCSNCGRTFTLIVRVEVSEPGLPTKGDELLSDD